jgi:hypothetical protein
MAGRSKAFAWLVFLGVLTGALVWFRGDLKDIWMRHVASSPEQESGRPGSESTPPAEGTEGRDASDMASSGLPSSTPGQEAVGESPSGLPPSPPLPDLSLQATQTERRRAFHLEKSVDHIVQRDEPFDAAGGKFTIDELEQKLGRPPEPRPILSTIEESDIGGLIRKPVQEGGTGRKPGSSYYGVRVVRAGENLWDIHHAIIREYFERRQVTLPMNADQPMPDGRSSGVGRLLKFIEGVVRIYNVQYQRAESDLNLIHPEHMLIYFKISELFDALDQLNAEDLRWLRYVRHQLLLDRPQEQRELLERGTFYSH